jgi:glucose/arabinose dehydrogenase
VRPRVAPLASPALLALLSTALLAGCAREDVPDPPAVEPSFTLRALEAQFDQPVFLGHAGDGSGALYVVEQAGVVQRLDRDGRQKSAYLDIRDRVLDGGERGLLGLAFHPRFEDNGRLFVHYTDNSGDTVIAEFRDSDGRVAASSERVLLRVDQPYANHNGGMIAFGPDGTLFVALGDGGSANDPGDRAQSLDSLLGKILRIDVDSAPAPIPYAIPPDNPFARRTAGAEIWAYGLRNPWRFSFDRQTGDLWIADVGQSDYEEVDHEPADSPGGVNYGWSRYEGRHIKNADRDAPGAVGPVAEYDHDGGHCSVTGGYVYRGSAIPSLRGHYLLGDYCSGVLWTVQPSRGHALAQLMDTGHNVSSFGEDEAGELYVVDHGGRVLKVVPG